MSQAILITAYTNFDHLERIITFFDSNFEIFIHIDKKSSISQVNLQTLNEFPQVKGVSRKYRVNWGGRNHLKSILFLCELALRNPKNQYFHLISGHDFPIKKKSYFIDFFKDNSTQYLNHFDFPSQSWKGNGGLDRIYYYNFYDLLDAKKSKEKQLLLWLLKWQKKIGYKRKELFKLPKLHAGETWWSLNRDCVEYVVDYTKEQKGLLKRLKHIFCSEEFYFQTVIMNSKFADNVQNNNLRFIDWDHRNGNSPAVLDDSDFKRIKSCDAFFARKFDFPISNKFLSNLMLDLKE